MIGTSHSIAKASLLSDRACLQVSGEERLGFLQGLVTNDVASLSQDAALFAALLTPQGKILFDFFLVDTGDVVLMDCAATVAADLLKRLTFYKLRAKVAIEDVSASWRIGAVWGENPISFAEALGALAYRDPRLSELGCRVIVGALDDTTLYKASAGEYDIMRIGLAVPEGAKDYAFGDVFPHEACLDLLHGVDFKKGCYIGQEVVSRMQHRGTARKRVVGVSAEATLPADGADITADGFPVGRLGSVSDKQGVALARLDRVGEAISKGQQLLAGDIPVKVFAPSWASYSLGATEAAAL